MTLTNAQLEQTITKGQLVSIIGKISGKLAGKDYADAWDGNAPAWFPEPPEWLDLLEEALTEVESEAAQETGETLEFRAIWEAIKDWDIQRELGGRYLGIAGYAGATGTDVRHIENSIRAMRGQEPVPEPSVEEIEEFLEQIKRDNPEAFLTKDEELFNPELHKPVPPVDPEAVDKDCGC